MEAWEKYKFRNLWQHPIWAEVQRANGRQIWQLETSGAQALVIKHGLPFGLCWFEVPRGPLFEKAADFEEIMKQIREMADREKAVFVRLSSYQEVTGENFKATKYDHHPETSLVIDLDGSEEDILAQMKPKGRYNIKVASKHNVTVEVSQDVDAFYGILKTTANRDGFSLHPKSYYQKMLEVLGDDAELLLATYQERVVAGGIFVYLDEWGIYYYGASETQYRNTMAPYAVQWQAIRESKKRGCKYYDFLGIAPEDSKNHPWQGVTRFKTRFGGRTVNYPRAKDLVLRPFWYLVYNLRKKI